ncbi:hypothetical protein [Pontibacter ruber]|uniref:Uncharacterized protein n=1 Tax=Pontibacter ruber TaxID=1343895 RepID=A0ABW5CX60_9BACT|nr:hypothetical protein [Pontibacter ruber]
MIDPKKDYSSADNALKVQKNVLIDAVRISTLKVENGAGINSICRSTMLSYLHMPYFELVQLL